MLFLLPVLVTMTVGDALVPPQCTAPVRSAATRARHSIEMAGDAPKNSAFVFVKCVSGRRGIGNTACAGRTR